MYIDNLVQTSKLEFVRDKYAVIFDAQNLFDGDFFLFQKIRLDINCKFKILIQRPLIQLS